MLSEILESKIMTKDMCKEYDDNNTIGITANTKDKEIFTSGKKVYYKINKVSKTEAKLLQSKKLLSIKPNVTGKQLSQIKHVAVYNKKTDEYYYEKGLIEITDENRESFKIHEYDDDKPIKEFYLGRYGMYKQIGNHTGIDVKKLFYDPILVGREIAYQNLKHLWGTECISKNEAKIIDGSTRGPLHYAVKGKVKDVYDYDYNSMYIHIMSNSEFQFPVTMPTQTKDALKENQMEIVKCNVKGGHKWWRSTPDNYYNTYQLQLLDLLEIPYSRDEDERYVYDVINSKEIFGFMKELYEYKKMGNTCVKQIINSIWGSLGKQGIFCVKLDCLKKSDMKNVVHVDLITDIATLENDKPYKHTFGRIKSFILAYARLMLVRDSMLPVEKAGYTIYQANTDGFISDIPRKKMTKIKTISEQMGDLKIEKEFKGTHDIVHVRRIDKTQCDDFEEVDV
jgi:hypothetical protein